VNDDAIRTHYRDIANHAIHFAADFDCLDSVGADADQRDVSVDFVVVVAAAAVTASYDAEVNIVMMSLVVASGMVVERLAVVAVAKQDGTELMEYSSSRMC
jgi:hypothetical protein